MRCKDVEGLLAGHALGELSASEQEGVEEHLQGCSSCVQALEATKQTMSLLGGWEPAEPSPTLVARTLSALEDERARPQGLRDKITAFFDGLWDLRITPLTGGVALVLGVFMFVTLHNIQSVRVADSGASCQDNVRSLGMAAKEFKAAHGGQAPEHIAELTPNFITEIPTCPVAGFDTYSESYHRDPETQNVEIFCKGNHHLNEGLPPDSPRVTSPGPD